MAINKLTINSSTTDEMFGTVNGLVDFSGAQVPHLKLLADTEKVDKRQYFAGGFYEGATVGGGVFVWDAAKDKAEHNGGTIIAPEALTAWDGTHGQLASYLDWSGIGVGCFVRVNFESLLATFFGLSSNLSPSNSKVCLNKFHSTSHGSYILDADYQIIVDGSVKLEEKVNINYDSLSCSILSNNPLEPAFKLSGRYCSIKKLPTLGFSQDVTLDYGTENDLGAVALQFTGLARSNIGEIRIKHAGIGFNLAQHAGFGWPTSNNMFSVTFGFIDINDVSFQFFDLNPWQGGNTGSVINSLYMNNNVNGTVKKCVRFGDIGGCSEMLVSLMNTEHAETSNLLRFSSDCDSFNVNTFHVEGIRTLNQNNYLIYLNENTKLLIDSFVMTYNYFTDDALEKNYIFRLGGTPSVRVVNFTERDAIKTGTPHFKMYYFGAVQLSPCKISIYSFNSGSFDSLLSGDGVLSSYRQYPPLSVDGLYPDQIPLKLDDQSLVWNPQAKTSRVIVYKNQTTVRTFTTLENGRYEGATCKIYNTSPSHEVAVTAGSLTFNIPVNSSTSLVCIDDNWIAT